jgi:hypothetical protein
MRRRVFIAGIGGSRRQRWLSFGATLRQQELRHGAHHKNLVLGHCLQAATLHHLASLPGHVCLSL